MTAEPRMRGNRFQRPTRKKKSREKTGIAEDTFPYQEEVTVDPLQVSSKAMNALEHLGMQRFALPPFSEHFDRWIKDVEVVLTEFETTLPNIADEEYRASVRNIMLSLRQTLHKQVESERNSSGESAKVIQELNSSELELSKLEHEYRKATYETRKKHEKALARLQSEIDMLEKQRLRLLRRNASIVERLLGRSASKLEACTDALQSKRTEFDSKGAILAHDLDELRAKYDIKRSTLSKREELFKAKLAEVNANASDDALELRNAACQDLRLTLDQAVGRSRKDQIPTDPEGSQ